MFTFIATAVAAVFAGWAAKATAQTVAIAAHASRVELRAYLSVIPGGINEMIGNQRAMGHVDIHNVGKLPAREVVVQVRMKILDREDTPAERKGDFPVIDDPYDPKKVDNIDRAVLPGTKMRQGAAEGDTIPVSDLLLAKDKYLYVWGVVHYSDGYQRRHTHFRQRYAIASHVRRDDWHNPTYETREIIAVDQARVHPYGNRAN